jgi:hypothetical protein
VKNKKKIKNLKMSNNQKLFKDAIADAKALREVAIANAKAALEESFSPRIQSMFEKRIMEAEELDEETELDEKVTYQGDKDNLIDPLDENMDIDDSMEEEIDLEELFNSLSEEEDMEEGYGAREYEEGRDSEMEEDEDYDLDEILAELEKEDSLEEGEEEEINENTMFEKATGDEGIGEITVDEMREMIQDAIKAALGDAGNGGDEEMDMGMDLDMGDEGESEDMDLDIDMGAEDGEDEEGKDEEKPKKKSKKDELDERKRYKMNPKKELDEYFSFSDKGPASQRAKNKPSDVLGRRGQGQITPDNKDAYKKVVGKKGDMGKFYGNVGPKGSLPETEELEEAINVIQSLRAQLNEVNLLNAKLIYVNRIFKSNNLNESQKVKVVNSFDKAQTLNEAKNIYEVIKDTFRSTSLGKNKTQLHESKSFASSIIGGKTAKNPIIDSNDSISRMQKLAGII